MAAEECCCLSRRLLARWNKAGCDAAGHGGRDAVQLREAGNDKPWPDAPRLGLAAKLSQAAAWRPEAGRYLADRVTAATMPFACHGRARRAQAW